MDGLLGESRPSKYHWECCRLQHLHCFRVPRDLTSMGERVVYRIHGVFLMLAGLVGGKKRIRMVGE